MDTIGGAAEKKDTQKNILRRFKMELLKKYMPHREFV